MIATAKPN